MYSKWRLELNRGHILYWVCAICWWLWVILGNSSSVQAKAYYKYQIKCITVCTYISYIWDILRECCYFVPYFPPANTVILKLSIKFILNGNLKWWLLFSQTMKSNKVAKRLKIMTMTTRSTNPPVALWTGSGFCWRTWTIIPRQVSGGPGASPTGPRSCVMWSVAVVAQRTYQIIRNNLALLKGWASSSLPFTLRGDRRPLTVESNQWGWRWLEQWKLFFFFFL